MNRPMQHAPFAAQSGRLFYFLWSVERLAMCLGLQTINKKDWYSWGANILLASQANDGQWRGQFSRGGADTCFALLFLARSNLAKDLTAHLHGRVRDPGQVTLRSSETGLDDQAPPKSHRPAIKPVATAPEINPPDGKTAARLPDLPIARPAPAAAAVQPTKAPAAPVQLSKAPAAAVSETALLTEQILRAPADQIDQMLDRLRDARGVANTEALAAAIPKLPPDGKKKARDALAERLSRMRAGSLAKYLKDDDAEIRRGAALALAMRDQKNRIPDLIPLLNDPQQAVVLGARSALRELTGKDFGPEPHASSEDKARAAAQWQAWWEGSQGR
jgi:hypothetical protein